MNPFSPERIVVPFDFSDRAVETLRVATNHASRNTRVHVVHVINDLHPADPYFVLNDFDEQEFKAKSFQALEAKLREADFNPEDFELNVLIGDPGSKLADFARSIDADLLIISSHGRTGLKRVLLGSVAERVARLAECPVLVLKETP